MMSGNSHTAPHSPTQSSRIVNWNAFLMAHNEERYISITVQSLLSQSIPPKKILIVDDGSTDSTLKILDSMMIQDATIQTRMLPAHKSDLSSLDFWAKRTNLMKDASQQGIPDYVISLDADTVLSPKYAESITARMQQDDVMVAAGDDPAESRFLPGESGLVINCAWLRSVPAISLPAAIIVAYSALGGHRSIVYHTTEQAQRQRPTGFNYNPALYYNKGVILKWYGHPWYFALYKTLRAKQMSVFRGYRSYKKEQLPHCVQQWLWNLKQERLKQLLHIKSSMFQPTNIGTYILPDRQF